MSKGSTAMAFGPTQSVKGWGNKAQQYTHKRKTRWIYQDIWATITTLALLEQHDRCSQQKKHKVKGGFGGNERRFIGGSWWATLPGIMKILSWNIRGLGKPRTCLAIKKILYLFRPQIFFCCETKMLARQVNLIARSLNFENCLTVDRNGMSGGLALFWSSNMNI